MLKNRKFAWINDFFAFLFMFSMLKTSWKIVDKVGLIFLSYQNVDNIEKQEKCFSIGVENSVTSMVIFYIKG